MNRRLLSVVCVALLGLMLGACSKEESNSITIPNASILVSQPGESGSTEFDSRNITSFEVTDTPNGWTINSIDLYTKRITVTAPSTFDNGEVKEGDLELKGYTPTGNSRTISIYLAILPNADIDLSSKPANCFIATQAKTRYRFNPYIGGTATPLKTAYVALIWETRKGLISYLDMEDDRVTFYVGGVDDDDDSGLSLYPGNALIGAYNDADELIWSWHIWVSENNPEAAEYTTTMAGREIMSLNLGASSLNDGSGDEAKILNSYGMYYQWGRRTPLPGPFSWNFKNNEDARLYDVDGDMLYLEYAESTDDVGTVEWSNDNPISIILGNPDNSYNWLYSGTDDALWSTTSKTEHDPCPYGWRVPDSSIYENLTIADKDDALSWQEAQPMYGWWLKDTTSEAEYFFTAAGRRNYLDGRLDNMNANAEYPVPWSGYYWTTSTDGAKAVAMYFNLNTTTRTWNGFDAKHAMQRANAMPVRCVRE